jgi:hypothetical protein
MAPCPGGNLAQAECFLSIRKTTIFELMGWLKEIGSDCRLHPLIHTLLEFNFALDVESLRKRSRSSAGSLKNEQEMS